MIPINATTAVTNTVQLAVKSAAVDVTAAPRTDGSGVGMGVYLQSSSDARRGTRSTRPSRRRTGDARRLLAHLESCEPRPRHSQTHSERHEKQRIDNRVHQYGYRVGDLTGAHQNRRRIPAMKISTIAPAISPSTSIVPSAYIIDGSRTSTLRAPPRRTAATPYRSSGTRRDHELGLTAAPAQQPRRRCCTPLRTDLAHTSCPQRERHELHRRTRP